MSTSFPPDRWRRLQALFDEASALAGPDRHLFVERETAGDDEMAIALRGMLGHDGGGDWIRESVARAAVEVAESERWTGRTIGPYRIVRELGRGGMGVVFEARREDEYSLRVALKLAPSALATSILDARFRLERQILAGLEHPNIARFLDGGTHDGLPYIVMEYVEGQPITEYCRARSLSVQDRVALVRTLCHALAHAHQRLVVHRDLKPSNILVTGEGVPKLLDFGIAKILDPLADTPHTLGATTWTPDYASPEQVAGRLVTTRTDVYSLGLVLYELLTGERAQVADTSSPAALERSICEAEAPLPSARVAALGHAAAARRLRGDLDTIVANAVRKDPERRYESVASLAEDLDRHLDGRPILGRPSSFGYRAGKFLRRHRAVSAAVAVAGVALAAGLAGTIYQAQRAERRFQQVRSLANAFVFDIHDRIEMLPGATEARKAIVATALTYLETLGVDAGTDPSLARELAAAYERIGQVQGDPLSPNLGDPDGALTSYRRAQAMLDPLAARGDIEARGRLVSVWRKLANLRRAQGDVAGTREAYDRAREIGERLREQDPRNVAAMTALGEVYADMGRAAADRRDPAGAADVGSRAVAIAERLAGLDPANLQSQNNLASALNALASAHLTIARLPEAAGEYRRTVEIREGLVRADPANVEFRRGLMVSYGNLGDVLGYRLWENLGEPDAARQAFEKAVELAEQTYGEDPADRRAAFDVVNARLRLGSLLAEGAGMAEAQAALGQLERANALNNRLLSEEPGSSRYGYVSLVIHRRLGEALAAAGRTSEAVAHLDRVRTDAPAMLDGPLGSNARTQFVLARVRLARLRAGAGDRRANALLDEVSAELAVRPLAPPALTAQVHGDLAGAHAVLSRSGTPPARSRHRDAARLHFEQSLAGWASIAMPPTLEARKDSLVEALKADLGDIVARASR